MLDYDRCELKVWKLIAKFPRGGGGFVNTPVLQCVPSEHFLDASYYICSTEAHYRTNLQLEYRLH